MPYFVKEYVSLFMTPEVNKIITIIDNILHSFGLHVCVTSGNDGSHSKRSKHYRNQAVDIRVRDWDNHRTDIVKRVKNHLGPDYDVLDEGTHLHVEYDPK